MRITDPERPVTACLTAASLMACLVLTAPPDDDPEPRPRERRIEGVWAIEKQFGDGWPSPGGLRFEFTPRNYYLLGERGERGQALDYRLSPRKRPAQIDLDFGGAGVRKGIYKFEGERLYLTWANEKGGERPTSFDGKGTCIRVLQRVKK